MPFALKHLVAEACIATALIYGAETWLTGDFRPLELLYSKVVRALLGVQQTLPMDLCLTEAGLPGPRNAAVKKNFMGNATQLEADCP